MGFNYGTDFTCPDGYSITTNDPWNPHYGYFCVPRRDTFCCSSSWVSSGGDQCDALVFHDLEKKCSFSLCAAEELPSGWTRDTESADPNYRGKICPEDYEWIASGEIDCNDPCPSLSSCDACVDEDCVWSISRQTCRLICDEQPCLATPRLDPEINSGQLCHEFAQVQGDNLFCQAQSRSASCEVCTQSKLPSDESKECRWINDCAPKESWRGCEQCFATSCSSSCNQVDECSTPAPDGTPEPIEDKTPKPTPSLARSVSQDRLVVYLRRASMWLMLF